MKLKSFLKAIWGNIWPAKELIYEPKPSPLMGELLKKAYDFQMAWYRIQLSLNTEPLSGDVSEQSVILPKMDEVSKANLRHDKFLREFPSIIPSTVEEIGKTSNDDLYKYVGYNLYDANSDFYDPQLVFKNDGVYTLSYIKSKIKPEEFDKTLKRLFKKI